MDRNNIVLVSSRAYILSLSARRAWIEITQCRLKLSKCTVALRKESVDRNLVSGVNGAINIIVALRKESVDRNKRNGLQGNRNNTSLSARRAWIEI